MPTRTCRICPETAVVSAVIHETDEYERDEGYIAGVPLCAEHAREDEPLHPPHLQHSVSRVIWRIEDAVSL